MTDDEDRIGQLIGGYRLQRHLGKGSFGTVYLAEQTHNHSHAAVKLLRIRLTSRNDFREFLNEARTIRLHHPHIVSILDFGMTQDDIPFLIMEYAAGGTLRDRHLRGTKLPTEIVTSYVQQLASALQHAHDHHLIHQDVKPENMLIRSDGTVLLSDFGIAKIIEQSTLHSLQSTAGTPAYMAPEQSLGKPCPASDQYALAVIVYEWLSGSRPFQGGPLEVVIQHRMDPPPSLCVLCPELSPLVEEVLFKALSKAPTERFPRVAQFSEALQKAMEGTEVLTPTTPDPTVLSNVPTVILPSEESSTPGATPSRIVLPSPSAPGPLTHTIPDSREPAKIPSPPQSLPKTSPVGHPQVAAPRSGHRWRVLVTLLCLVLLIVTGGGATWLFMKQQHAQTAPSPATATASMRKILKDAETAYKTGTKGGVQLGFDAAHTNWNPYERIINPANVTQLATRWSYSTAGSISSSPIVANGVVYASSDDGNLYAFNATCQSTCSPLWSYQVGDANTSISSPTVANGVLYVSAALRVGNGPGDGKFYAFSATCRSACQPLWFYSAAGSTFSSPTVAQGVVFVSSSTYNQYGPPGSELYAFDATCQSACQPLWSYSIPNSYYNISPPTVAKGVVYVSSTAYNQFGPPDGTLYAFDATCQSACQPLWSYTIPSVIAQRVGGIAAMPVSYNSTGGPIISSPVVANGVVYVGFSSSYGSGGSKLYAFDATCQSDCQPLWSYSIQDSGYRENSPTVVNGVAYISSMNVYNGGSRLYALDTSCHGHCQPLWSYSVADGINSSPFVANGVVYVSSATHSNYSNGPGNSKLYAFSASCHSACKPLGSFAMDGYISSPFVANGVVYVGANVGPSEGIGAGSGSGKVYALGLPT